LVVLTVLRQVVRLRQALLALRLDQSWRSRYCGENQRITIEKMMIDVLKLGRKSIGGEVE
jgi:hypothetical protein